MLRLHAECKFDEKSLFTKTVETKKINKVAVQQQTKSGELTNSKVYQKFNYAS